MTFPYSPRVPNFVDRLPRVALDSMADHNRQCPICLAPYELDRGDGTVEEAAKLPCSHVAGRKCLAEWHFQDPDEHDDDRVERCLNSFEELGKWCGG